MKFIKYIDFDMNNPKSYYSHFSCSRWLISLINKKELEFAKGSRVCIKGHSISCKDFWDYIEL